LRLNYYLENICAPSSAPMNNFLCYTSPKLVSESRGRTYVTFRNHLSNEVFRFHTGKDFGMHSSRGLSPAEKDVYYRTLLSKVIVKLAEGWTPESIEKQNVALDFSFKEAATELEKFIPKADYGDKHKHTLLWYLKSLKQAYLGSKLNDITSASLTTFLMKRYTGSNTSYNTARRYCKGVFNLFQQLGYMDFNPVSNVKAKRAEATINAAFTPVELKSLFDYLKVTDIILYRVAILMYTTFLRPHQEIRLLKAKFFHFEAKQLILPPRYTKNGKQTTIPLQSNILDEFEFVRTLESENQIFGKVNPYYFSTKWGKKIRDHYPLKENQTLYSIRHTAAVETYKKTKDVALIQRLMHHSSMEVTIGYLRSLNCGVNGITADMYPSI
jgi:site-specific recombinase XerD